MKPFLSLALLVASITLVSRAELPAPTITPTLRAVDLSLGEAGEVTLADHSVAKVKVLQLDEKTDSMAKAVR